MTGCRTFNQLMKSLVALAFLIFACACVHSHDADKGLFAVPVTSYEEMDTKRFKQSVSNAAVRSEPWVKNDLQVALNFIGPFEGKLQFVVRERANAESIDKTTIIVIEDGYLDDSIRGARYRIVLEADMHGVWQVLTAHKAWRCWPHRGHEKFSTEPCR